jgi:hypothetical protein
MARKVSMRTMAKLPKQLAFVVLAILSSPVFAQGEQLQGQPNNLPNEISQIVQQWTERCSKKELARDLDAPQCWYAAAAALTRYADMAEELLRKQIEQQQTVWLERSAQVEMYQLGLQQEAQSVTAPMSTSSSAPVTESLIPKKPPPPFSPNPTSAEKAQKARVSSARLKHLDTRRTTKSAKVVEMKLRQKKALKVIANKKSGASAASEQIHTSEHVYHKKVVKTLRPSNRDSGDACSSLMCVFGKR